MEKSYVKCVAVDILGLARKAKIFDGACGVRVYNYSEDAARVVAHTHLIRARLTVVIDRRRGFIDCFGTVCGVCVYARYNNLNDLRANYVAFSSCDFLKILSRWEKDYSMDVYELKGGE